LGCPKKYNWVDDGPERTAAVEGIVIGTNPRIKLRRLNSMSRMETRRPEATTAFAMMDYFVYKRESTKTEQGAETSLRLASMTSYSKILLAQSMGSKKG
jgi:hypothetical protein